MEDVRLLMVAMVLLGVALCSRWLERRSISTPAAVVAIGFLMSLTPLYSANLTAASGAVRAIAEATLALMLFHDASRIGLKHLVGQSMLPARLLGIGLPVMIVLGTVLGYAMFPLLGWVGAALVATMLAPTDAALGEQVVSDKRLPSWLRQGLNVESGLNDGLSVPVFLVLIGLATSQNWHWGTLGVQLATLIGVGVVAGAIFGGLGGWLVRRAQQQGAMLGSWARYAVVAIALASYVAAALTGGSGFIAAFVGGLFFGTTSHQEGPEAMGFISHLGTVFDAVSFLLLGAVLLPVAVRYLSWQVVVYVVLSLLVVRMASVFVAMAGMKARTQTKAFIGWFGPRGLATVVFTIMLLDEQVANKELIATVAVVGVVLSVYAHGFTAPWLAGRYAEWYKPLKHQMDAESTHVPLPQGRRAAEKRAVLQSVGESSTRH
jgi:NhaP-type Na+/H+ or K+/H+ antiporter